MLGASLLDSLLKIRRKANVRSSQHDMANEVFAARREFHSTIIIMEVDNGPLNDNLYT